MSYREDDEGSEGHSNSIKKRVTTIGGVILLIVVAIVAKGLGRAGAEYGIASYQRHEAVAEIDTLLQNGEFADFFRALQGADPRRAAEFKEKMKSVIQNASSPKDANSQMFYFARSAMADFRKAALLAPDENVREVAQSRLDLMRTVRDDLGPSDCGRMAISGPWPNMPSTPDLKSAIMNASTVIVKAGAEGMKHPVNRTEPSQLVLKQWADGALSAGMTESELNALGENRLSSLSPDSQCKVAIIMFEVALSIDSSSLWQMLITDE